MRTQGCGVWVEVIRDVARWDGLETAWEQLWNASPAASPPLSFAWLRNWWDIYGNVYADRGRGLRILAVWRDERLIGVLPLYAGREHGSVLGIRRLGFLSSGEAEFEETCADYMDLLHAPGDEQASIEAIATTLMDSELLGCDELDLDRVCERSPLLNLRQWALRYNFTVIPRGRCYFAEYADGLDAYLGRLSQTTRSEARRLLRGAHKAQMELEIAGANDVDEFFDELIVLHEQRWRSEGRAGCFAAARFTEFHRRLARLWVPDGKAMLARLSWRGRALAMDYGLIVRDRYYAYLSAVPRDHQSPVRSPGTVQRLLLQQQLQVRGVTIFDTLLASPDSYKRRHATGETPVVRLKATRPGVRMALHTAAELMRRASGTGWRALRGRAAQPGNSKPAEVAEA